MNIILVGLVIGLILWVLVKVYDLEGELDDFFCGKQDEQYAELMEQFQELELDHEALTSENQVLRSRIFELEKNK